MGEPVYAAAVLVLVLAILVLVLALYRQSRETARLRTILEGLPEQRSTIPVVSPLGPHEHVWAAKPVRSKLGIGVFPCTVPGCTADPLCHAGKR